MSAPPDSALILHATSVSVEGKGALILGPSGSGKSALALQLMALGAQLVSDDRTEISLRDGGLIAAAPDAIAGLIEARNVGLLRAPYAGPTALSLVIDLAQTERDRLPHPHVYTIADITLPCVWQVPAPHFAPAILLCLQGGIDRQV